MKKRMIYSGYTLIEILIVLFIVSIVSGVALLSISRNESQQLTAFANELTETLTLAEEQAMLQPGILGLFVNDQSLRFVAYQATDEHKKNAWVPLYNKILGKKAIPQEMEVKIAFKDKQVGTKSADVFDANTPQIVISTNGDLTPFSIYVGKKGKKPRYVIRGDADGNVTNQLLS